MAKHLGKITTKDSDFGYSGHPVVPDGRIVKGPKASLPAEKLVRGHLVEILPRP